MNVKDATRISMIKMWNKTKDLPKFIKIVRATLNKPNSSPGIRGEMCEVVLELILKKYIHDHNKPWFVSKGLILKDPDRLDSNYSTELDLTLFTESLVVAFECKSYKGDKKLKKECSIYTKNSSGMYNFKYDVYSQHIKHFNILHKNIKQCLKTHKNVKPYKICLFQFAFGDLIDERDIKYKRLMPCIDEININKFLDSLSNREIYWNLQELKILVKNLESDKITKTKEHLNYVKSIRR